MMPVQSLTHDQAVEAGLITRDQADAVQAMQAFQARWQDDYKRLLIRFAAVVCGCPPVFTWHDGVAPQASCPLHSQMGSFGGDLA